MDTAAEKLMEKLSPTRVRVTFKLEDFKPPCSDFFSSFLFFFETKVTLLLAGTSLTFLQNYTVLLFSLGETNVCPLGISQRFWQQAADEEKWKFQYRSNSLECCMKTGCSEVLNRTFMVGADPEEYEALLEGPKVDVPVASV